ncbi:MAG TPA: hypothetical protein VFH16_00690 [Rubrobacter sp.]|nr:hypothetical protein [Rubrobacter sp.]
MSRVASEALRRTGTFRLILAVVSWLFVLIPAALPYLYVRAFGVNVVFADAWDMVLVFRKFSSGRLTFADFYAQHNEHRMFFPKGAELLLGLLTRYNNVAEMYVVVSCFLITAAVLLVAFRREIGLPLIFFVPVALLIFSFRQYENMLWGFQISFAFTQTFGVLALYLLSSSSRSNFGAYAFAALGSATIASFSTAQGLLVWPAGLLGLLLGSVAGPGKKVLVGLWGIVGVAEWVAYFVDYHTPRGHPPLLDALGHIGTAPEYFLTLLGSALFWQPEHAYAGGLVIGCLALAMFLATYGRGALREHPFWISLLFYSLFILATITLGRSGMFGVWQAAISRYTTFSILAVASVYAMLAKMVFATRASILRTVLLIALFGTILLSAGISYRNGIEVGRAQEASRERAAHVLETYRSQPDARLAATLYPRAETVRRRAPLLERLGYNVFSEQSPPDPSVLHND